MMKILSIACKYIRRLKRKLVVDIFGNGNLSVITVLIDQSVMSGVNFANAILLSRALGIEMFGKFVYLWMVVHVFMAINQALVISPLLSVYPKHSDARSYLSGLYSTQVFSSICYLIPSLIGLRALWYFDMINLTAVEVTYTALLCAVVPFHDFFRRYLLITGFEFRALFLDVVSYSLLPIWLIISSFTNIENGLILVLALQLTSITIGLLIIIFLHKDSFTIILRKKAYYRKFIEIWQYSKYLFYTSFIQVLTGNIFMFTSATIIGPQALGVVRIIQNTFGFTNILFNSLENILPSRAARLYKQSGEIGLRNFMIKQFFFWVSICLLLVFIPVIYRRELISLLYGEEYVEYSYLLLYAALLCLLIYTGNIYRINIRTKGNNITIFRAYVLMTISSLISHRFLIKEFGIQGVFFGLILLQIISITFYALSMKYSKE